MVRGEFWHLLFLLFIFGDGRVAVPVSSCKASGPGVHRWLCTLEWGISKFVCAFLVKFPNAVLVEHRCVPEFYVRTEGSDYASASVFTASQTAANQIPQNSKLHYL